MENKHHPPILKTKPLQIPFYTVSTNIFLSQTTCQANYVVKTVTLEANENATIVILTAEE